MKFMHLEYVIPILLFFVIYVFYNVKIEKKFFKWVEDHWFFKTRMKFKISTYLYFGGILLLLIGFLDPRGAEKHVSVKSSDLKTIIMIDTSASMLVEDVRPNRFEKAIFLAKHYVKKAVGQKISVLVFSDSSTKLVPFTEDKNLIEARLDSLKSLNLRRGGTGLTLAMNEAIQYLKGSDEEINGNILIFTDAEEHEVKMISNIPNAVNVGVIGVGTAKGGPIPIRNDRGVFQENKKYKGEVVISKLDENNLKKIGANINHFRYWVASSYSLPTNEILHFFKQIKLSKDDENDIKIRPVLYEYFLIPGVVLLIISLILRNGKMFIAPLLLLVLVKPSQAQLGNIQPDQKNKEPVKSELTLELEKKMAKGGFNKKGKFALAYSLLKDGFPKDADSLYSELFKDEQELNFKNIVFKFNHAAAKIQNEKTKEGINDFYSIIKLGNQALPNIKDTKSKESLENILQKAKENILLALSSSGGGQAQGESKSDDKNEESKNKDKNSKSGEGQGDQSEKNDNESESKDGENKEDQKDKSQGENENEPKDQSDQKGNKASDKESNEEKEKRKAKLPQLLKQLLNDDNKLQKKLIDADTSKRKRVEAKDW